MALPDYFTGCLVYLVNPIKLKGLTTEKIAWQIGSSKFINVLNNSLRRPYC